MTKTKRILQLVKALCIMILLSTSNVSAQFQTGAEIIYAYFIEDPLTVIHLNWIDKNDQPRSLNYRIKDSTGWISFSTTKSIRIPGSTNYVHKARISNLNAGTTYEFRIGSDGTTHTFKTLPQLLEEPLSFVNGGDMYHSASLMIPVTQAAAARNPNFAVIGGDWAYADGDTTKVNRWFRLFEIWQEFMAPPDGHIVPFVPAIGNHEVRGAYNRPPSHAPLYFTFFDLPDKRAYYTLDFGNYLSLIILDSNHTNSIDGQQKNWLRQVLEDRQDVPHVFPVYHVPAFPSFRDNTNTHSTMVREHWVPLFEEFGIQLAMENHDHTFKRTKPIRNLNVDPEGVVYIGDGAWGVGTRMDPDAPSRWYLEKVSGTHHYWNLTLYSNLRFIEAYDKNNEQLDAFYQQTSVQGIPEARNPLPKIPGELFLAQNYPNPFNTSTLIPFSVPFNDIPQNVRLDIHNIQGQRLATLINEPLVPGSHYIKFDASSLSLSSGVYMYRLQIGNKTRIKQMQLIK